MEKQVKILSSPPLPSDMIMEIFSWLPARSVGRLPTVSKLYYGLLSKPSFIKNHLLHGGGISSTKLLVNLINYRPKKTWYIYYPIHNNITEFNYSSYGIVDDAITLDGSCNGLFCVRNSKGLLALWNPTTREASRLAELPEEIKLNCFRFDNLRYQYTFGYDSLNDDYKIVCVICVYKKEGTGVLVERPSTSNKTYMYSHKRGCWRKIKPFPPYCIQYSCGNQIAHGKIHWLAYSSRDKDGRKQSQFIVSLDLANERYGSFSQPASYRYHPGDDLNVCVLGGELCVYINGKNGRGFEIWMMREYGVEQSWFQLLEIPFHSLQYFPHPLSSSAICMPIFQMKGGEILLWASEHDGESIYSYNPKTCNFITVHTISERFNALLFGYIYVESLVETAISLV